MGKSTLARNILLAFVFFFIGRYLVQQMGDTGIIVIFVLVAVFYLGWWFLHRKRG